LETAWSPADVERELRRLSAERSADDQAEPTWCAAPDGGEFRMVQGGPPAIGRTPVMVLGRVRPTSGGSRIVVTMRVSLPAMLLLFVVVPLLTMLSAAVSVAALVRNEGLVLLVWIMPLALWNGILRSFRREAVSGEAFFRKLFPPVAPPVAGPFR
jgi:hypothetical protein